MKRLRCSPLPLRCQQVALGVATLVALMMLPSGQAGAQDAGGSGPGAGILVQAAGELFVHPRREAPANVVARNESRISAQVAAVIEAIEAEPGQTVQAGALLARLEDRDLRLALAQVQAQRDGLRARLDLAQSQLQRARELKTNNFVTAEAVNQRTAEVVTLQAELKATDTQVAVARRQLDKTEVRAPFTAVVSARQAQLGELTSPGAPLFTLTQLGDEEIVAKLPDSLAAGIIRGGPFEFLAAGQSLALALVRVSPVVARDSRTREARFRFVSQRLPAGTDGRLQWADPDPHLPARLLVRRDNQTGVFLAEDGKAIFLALPAAQEGRPVAVSLPADAQLVAQGQVSLQPGQPLPR